MALTSTLQDFEVRQGLIVLGTGTVTSSTAMTGTLQVYGGAAIAKNLIVGTSAEFGGNTFVRQNFTVDGASFVTGLTSTQAITVTAATQATTGGAGALKVTGGGYFGNNLVVSSIAASTTTAVSNALYVAGGAGFGGSLYVQGDAVFQNNVAFLGETTYVYSTNTVYTDSILELHYHENTSSWTIDDDQDIGLRFHFFDTTNTNAFLGRVNTSGYLEWFGRGVTETTSATIQGGTYGTFKTGSIILTDSTTASNTTSGALTVEGGIGAKGNIFGGKISADNLTPAVGNLARVALIGPNKELIDDEGLTYNTVTNNLSVNVGSSDAATNLLGGATGSLPYQQSTGTTVFLPIGTAGLVLVSDGSKPIWATTGTIASGQSFTATNINFGEQYQIPYQTAPGSTTFSDGLKYDYNDLRFRTPRAAFTSTLASFTTASGAVTVAGGVGIGGAVFIGEGLEVGQNLVVDGGTIGSRSTTVNVFNTTATTVNAFGAATSLTLGATSGNTFIRNITTVTDTTQSTNLDNGALRVDGGLAVKRNLNVGESLVAYGIVEARNGIITNQTTFSLINGTATTVSFAGAATALTMGAGSGFIDLRNLTTVTNTTGAISTDSGALRVYGGVGIAENLYVGGNGVFTGDVEVKGGDLTTDQSAFNLINTNATTVNLAGAATTLTVGATSGNTTIRNNTTVSSVTSSVSTDSGALRVYGGVGIAENLYVGGNIVATGDVAVNGGDLTTDQTTFNLVNTTATTVNFAGSGTAITVGATTGYTQIRNQTTITNTVNATSHLTGALQVRGGAGISGNLYVNQALNVTGVSTLQNVSSQVTTATNLTVNGITTLASTVNITDNQNATTPTNGVLRVTGGVGIVRDVVVGGAITAGYTNAQTIATVVPALYSNNFLIASYTSGVISGVTQVALDSYSSAVYRSARYFCQIVDGTNVHISEISIFHDGTKAYLNEYGIATNNGQLGMFDANLSGGTVQMNFTPYNATTMTVKLIRIGLSA